MEQFTGKEVELPALKDVPGLDLEVVNYHRPAVGTFHSKVGNAPCVGVSMRGHFSLKLPCSTWWSTARWLCSIGE